MRTSDADTPGSLRRAAGWPPEPWGARLRWALIACLLVVLTWPIGSPLPTGGVDSSWASGLHMAAANGTGTDIIFTHGPLAFAFIPQLWEASTYWLAFVGTLLVQLVLVALVLFGLRRSYPWWVAVPATYLLLVALSAFGGPERAPDYLTIVIGLVALAMVQGRLAGRWEVAAPILLGALAGAAILVKVSTGALAIAVLAIAVIPALPTHRVRGVVLVLATALITMPLAWFIFGGGVSGLLTWIRLSVDITSGYPEAMGYQPEGAGWHYLVALALVMVIIWRVVSLARQWDRARWIALALVVAAIVTVVARQGFVRNDPPHAIFAILMLALVLAVLPAPGIERIVTGCALVAAVVVMATVAGQGIGPEWKLWPGSRAVAFAHQAYAAGNPWHARDLIAQAKRDGAAAYGIPANVLDAIGSDTVAIEPYEIGAAWAVGLNWQPVPIIQPYSAYTKALDEKNAAALASTGGPQHLLWQQGAVSVGNRRLDADSPTYALAAVCDFQLEAQGNGWWDYRRGPSRCERGRPLGSPVEKAPGQVFRVPRAPEAEALVYARIDAKLPLSQRVLGALLVPTDYPWITMNDVYGYRFVTATAASTWVMRVPPSLQQELKAQDLSQVETFAITGVAEPIRVQFYWAPVVPSGGVAQPWDDGSSG